LITRKPVVMRIDCHLHTSLLSCCSRVSPQRACEAALARGLDALLFTEHGLYWEQPKLRALQAMYPGIRLYSGLEIALAEGYHVVLFGRRIPGLQMPGLTMPQVQDLIAPFRQDVFVFVAHAFRYQSFPLPELPGILAACDGLEMRSINILRGRAVCRDGRIQSKDLAQYEHHLAAHQLTPLYNTDGHDEDIIGLIGNEFPGTAPPRDEIALARLFKSRQPGEYQNADRLARHHLLHQPETLGLI
jgi:hypothetical protein